MIVWSWLVAPPNKRGYGRWMTVIPSGDSSVKQTSVGKSTSHNTSTTFKTPISHPVLLPYIDSQIPAPPTTASPKTFYKLGNDSYKVVTQKMRWDEARRQCQADDADLASILNAYSQAYLTLQISKYNEPVWIGLNSNVVKDLPAIVCLDVFSSVKMPCNVVLLYSF